MRETSEYFSVLGGYFCVHLWPDNFKIFSRGHLGTVVLIHQDKAFLDPLIVFFSRSCCENRDCQQQKHNACQIKDSEYVFD